MATFGLKAALLSAGRLMPERARRAIVNMGFNLDRAHFDSLAHHYSFLPHMAHGLAFLRDRGLEPRGILDIGAFEGDWTRLARSVWPRSPVMMFEANEAKLPRLRTLASDDGITLQPALLGATSGQEVTFHVMESGSSVFEEHSPHRRTSVVQRLTALDDLVGDDVHPDLIKIDVQGYELEVLRGGEKTLARAKAVLIELSLLEINEGTPLLHEVLPFMAERGFLSYDILEVHRRPLDNAMNQIDVLFVPAGSPLRADKRHYAES